MNCRNRRYLLVIALSHMILDMYSGMLPALIPYLLDKFLLSYSAAGALLAWSSMTSSLIQPVLGFVSDMTGGLGLVIGGLALSSLAIASTGYITSYPLLAAAAIMAGLGNAVYHPQSASIMARLSTEQRSSAMGLYGVAGSIGFALGPSVLAMALAIGNSSMFWVVALPGILMGLTMKVMGQASQVFDKPCAAPASSPVETQEIDGNGHPNGRNMWVAEILLLGIVMLRSFIQYGVVTFLPQYITQILGGSSNTSPRLQSLFLAACAIGTFAGGVASDRFGRRSLFIASLICLIPVHWALCNTRTVSLFAMLLALEGFVLMSTFSGGLLMSQDFLPRLTGLASGLHIGISTTMGGVGATITGLVADTRGLAFAFASLVLCPIIGLCLTPLLPRDKRPRITHAPGAIPE